MNNRNLLKIVAGLLWGIVLVAFGVCKVKYGLDTRVIVDALYTLVLQTYYGPLLYILVYTLRPVIFFPALFLTILSGALFGLWGGILYTVVGENLSAMLAYSIGRFMGGDLLNSSRMVFFSRWRDSLKENSFMSVLFMRLIYLPFDLVNYGCGALGVKWKAYTFATLIGIMPGLVTFVSIGASLKVDQLFSGSYDIAFSSVIDGRQVIISALLFGASLLLAKMVHYNQKSHKAAGRE